VGEEPIKLGKSTKGVPKALLKVDPKGKVRTTFPNQNEAYISNGVEGKESQIGREGY